jgi:protein TonB
MRYGIVLSFILHVLVIVPLLFFYTPTLNEPPGRETPPTRYVAQTVNIESLQPTPTPVSQPEAPPPTKEPELIVSEAEQATTVAPVEPETVESEAPKPPPPEQVAMQEPEPLPEPEPEPPPENAVEAEPIPKPEPPPEPEPEPRPEPEPPPEPEPRPEPEPPPEPEPQPPPEQALEPQAPVTPPTPPPNQQAMLDQQPTRGSASSGNTLQAQSGGGTPGQRADYFAELRVWLEQHKQYPYMAQRMRQEGTVQLRFVMDREGHVLSYNIDKSSGYSTLDGEVEELIQRAEPLPPLPDEMTQARIELVVPVSFYLQ